MAFFFVEFFLDFCNFLLFLDFKYTCPDYYVQFFVDVGPKRLVGLAPTAQRVAIEVDLPPLGGDVEEEIAQNL